MLVYLSPPVHAWLQFSRNSYAYIGKDKIVCVGVKNCHQQPCTASTCRVSIENIEEKRVNDCKTFGGSGHGVFKRTTRLRVHCKKTLASVVNLMDAQSSLRTWDDAGSAA